jgi:PTS system mannitol-specific IIC component
MANTYTPPVQGSGFNATVQRIGGYLAGMVMPNIGAFIAWGLITAFFIPKGWTPNATIEEMVGPMITYLLPILIGYTGGRLVHGQRGAVVAAVATVGVVVGADVPMFLGAMIIGPAAAYIVRLWDGMIEGKIRPGFEMLVDNFSAGIIGAVMAIFGQWAIGPSVSWLANRAEDGVSWLIDHHLLGLVSILVEPGKVLFLNNAINHGVFTPLGASEAAEKGKSILFMIETNPGPGLGLLLAFWLFGPRALRPTVPAAMIIQFLGGIHEIYFPYVLMKPRLILAMIGGGAAGVSTYMVTGAGLVSAPAPGSIFAYLAVTPKGGWFVVLLGIVIACAVTFALASLLLGFGRNEPAEDELDEAEVAREEAELNAARQQSAENKAASKLGQEPATVNRAATPREA